MTLGYVPEDPYCSKRPQPCGAFQLVRIAVSGTSFDGAPGRCRRLGLSTPGPKGNVCAASRVTPASRCGQSGPCSISRPSSVRLPRRLACRVRPSTGSTGIPWRRQPLSNGLAKRTELVLVPDQSSIQNLFTWSALVHRRMAGRHCAGIGRCSLSCSLSFWADWFQD